MRARKRAQQPAGARLVPASEGVGPLLQRDYWAIVAGCRLPPRGVIAFVRERFGELAPEALVGFGRGPGEAGRLEVGAQLEVQIRGAGTAAVRVVHVDACSLTLGTVIGHPESGRITFGAYPNSQGDVVFHIRSRARSSSRLRLAGFLLVGDPMQTNTWTDFIDRLAHTVGNGVAGAIHVGTLRADEHDDDRSLAAPTFVARGE